MKYLSLYKTSSEHSGDNSRLIPNISLITGEQKLILTNENNISTEFNEVDIIESFDDIINRFDIINIFPSGNSTSMPGLNIYGDNTDQSKAKNIKIFNDAQRWRKDYLSHNGLSDTNQKIRINADTLMMDNIIMGKYDGNHQCYIDIYNDYIILFNDIDIWFAEVYGNSKFGGEAGLVDITNNVFPYPTETRMPYLRLFFSDPELTIEVYNDAIQWRKDYISYKGLSDTGQPISMYINQLDLDLSIMDVYNNSYNYHIDIYNDHITLLNNDGEEILTISSDGSFTILDIFNKFPYPIIIPDPETGGYLDMYGLKIYTDNTDQSKSNNIELYNDAQQYRKNYISNNNLSDTGQPIKLIINALIIDDKVIDESDYKYEYRIYIYDDRIILLKCLYYEQYGLEVLTIYSDGSVNVHTTTTTPTPTP